MKAPAISILMLLAIGLTPVAAFGNGFSGKFRAILDDQYYQLFLYRNQSGKFEGKLTIDGRILLLNALKLGEKIGGQLTGASEHISFTAQLAGHNILMRFEDGKLIRFKPDR